jgi:hypothetical protein
MMPDDIMKFFASLGVGGILAGVIFYFYHQRVTDWMKSADTRLEAEQRRSDALLLVVKENTASNTAVVKSVEANTAMVARLCHMREFLDFDETDNQGRRRSPRPASGG